MKKAGSYISSFIISVLFVFTLIASLLCITASSCASESRLIQLTREKNITSMVRSELDKYFNDRSHTTEIPAEIYMNSIDEGYLNGVIAAKIKCGFADLRQQHIIEQDIPYKKNEAMEADLERYFSEYAAKIGYEKDEKYEKKLNEAKNNAYKIINEYCDIFKFGALGRHGVLKKVSPIFIKLDLLTGVSCSAAAVLAILLIIINLNGLPASLYWIGTSGLVAGAMGAAPCIYVKATDMLSAFTIKQAQIYTAYTGAMGICIDFFMTLSIGAAALGILFILIYGITCAVNSKAEKKSKNKKEKKSQKSDDSGSAASDKEENVQN